MSVSRSLVVSSGWLSGQRHFGLRLWYGSGRACPRDRDTAKSKPSDGCLQNQESFLATPFLLLLPTWGTVSCLDSVVPGD